MAAQPGIAAAVQGDDQGKLEAGDDGRRQDDEGGHDGPRGDVTGEAEGAEPAQDDRRERDPVPHGEGDHEAQGLEGAGPGEAGEGRRTVLTEPRIEPAADSDAEERHAEDEAEGVRRSTEDRCEHPIPDQLHQQKGEAGDARGKARKPGESCCRNSAARGVRGSAHPGRSLRRATRNCPGRHPHEGVDEASEPQRHPSAEHFQEQEVRREGPGDRTDGVDGVQRAHVAPLDVVCGGDSSCGSRQRPAHDEGGDAEHDGGEQEANEGGAGDAQGWGASDCHIETAGAEKEQRCGRGAGSDGELEVGIQAQGSGEPVGAPSEQQPADTEPAHEHREDCRAGGRGSPEHEAQLTKPRDLIDQRTEPGGEQQGRDGRHPGRRRGGWRGCPRCCRHLVFEGRRSAVDDGDYGGGGRLRSGHWRAP